MSEVVLALINSSNSKPDQVNNKELTALLLANKIKTNKSKHINN